MGTEVISQYLELFLAFCGVVAALAAFVRWGQKGLEKKISEQIKDATSQIQRNANGGQSLKDLHDKVDCLVENQALIKRDVDLLKVAVVKLKNDAEGIE